MQFLDLQRQYASYREEIDTRMRRVLEHTRFVMGPEIEELEQVLAARVSVAHAITTASGTSGLELSLRALEIGPGDEVITVPYTWVSTAECIKQVGAKPIFVDIRKDFCINVDEIKEKINKKTKAIIGVDLYGNVCDIDSLKKFNIPVIEDAAQSTGALYKGKRVGGIADLTCFSFYPTKNLSLIHI